MNPSEDERRKKKGNHHIRLQKVGYTLYWLWWLCMLHREANSACTSGSLWSSSISSGWTRRRSERSECPDLLDLLLFVDLADLVLLARVDWRCSRFCEMVRCKFFCEEVAALVANHGWLYAFVAVIRSLGSTTRVLSMKSFAREDISFQCCKTTKKIWFANTEFFKNYLLLSTTDSRNKHFQTLILQ